MAWRIAALLVVFAVRGSVAADAKPTIPARVELRDGSRLIGQVAQQEYAFIRDDGRKLRLSTKQTIRIVADNDRELSTVYLADGAVRGVVQWKQLEISGLFGTVKVSFDQVSRIQFVQPKLGLVAHFRFDGDCRDSSGNNNHGKLHDDVKFVPGKFGKAASFDGTGDYISVVPKSDVTKIDDFSISAWVFIEKWKKQPAAFKFDKQFVFDGFSEPHRRVFYGNGFGLSCDNGSNLERICSSLYVDNVNYRWNRCSVQLSRQWRLLTVTRTRHRKSTYLDGELQSASSGASVGTTDRALNMNHVWHIGTYAANDRNYDAIRRGFRYGFLGQIDDLRIYRRALDPLEVCQLATGKSQQ